MLDSSIHEYVDAQHELLDLGLSAIGRAARAHDLTGARLHLRRFRADLRRYVRGEERLLFPLYDHLPTTLAGATSRLHHEHAHLARMAARLDMLLARADQEAAVRGLGTLRSLLLVHHAKEDWVIYARLADLSSSELAARLRDDLDPGAAARVESEATSDAAALRRWENEGGRT